MMAFVYDGSITGHAVWRVAGLEFPSGVPIPVTEAQARKLRCLPFFAEAPPFDEETDPDDGTAAAVHEAPIPEPSDVIPFKRKRGRPPGSKNKPKVTDGNEDAG